MMNINELFLMAKNNGIKRSWIGKEIWGNKQYNMIYMLKNPTQKTLFKVEKAIKKLIYEKNNK